MWKPCLPCIGYINRNLCLGRTGECVFATLENRMFDLDVEEGEEANDYSLSGRAHWLVRKPLALGWIELDPLAYSMEDYIAIPDYAVRILQIFYEISEDKP
jgi:hypothetical protein